MKHSASLLGRIALSLIITLTVSLDAVAKLPKLSGAPLQGYDMASVKRAMDSRPLHHIEGIWLMTDPSAKIAIELEDASNGISSMDAPAYRIVLLSSPNRALRPGTVMGRIVPAAKEGVYQTELYTSATGSRLSSPAAFTAELDKTDNRIVMTRHRSTFSVNLWRTLPYMWRYVIRKNRPAPTYHGCVRIYPEPVPPLQPIYL